MMHRHLIGGAYSCAAIDDVIGRGSRADGEALRDAADAQPYLLQKILRVWKYHAEHAIANLLLKEVP